MAHTAGTLPKSNIFSQCAHMNPAGNPPKGKPSAHAQRAAAAADCGDEPQYEHAWLLNHLLSCGFTDSVEH